MRFYIADKISRLWFWEKTNFVNHFGLHFIEKFATEVVQPP